MVLTIFQRESNYANLDFCSDANILVIQNWAKKL